MKQILLLAISLLLVSCSNHSNEKSKFIDENTPSKSMYFSWINNCWEGGDEKQTLANNEGDIIYANSRVMYSDYYGVVRGYSNKKHGFSVRCLKD